MAACAAEDREPRQLQPAASDPNFVLYVTNKSADTVDIKVRIDADLAVEGDFPVGTEYSFDFGLVPGGHSVNCVSEGAEIQRVDLFDIETAGVVYGIVEFVDATPKTGEPGFTWTVSDSPPAFEGTVEGEKD